jgi:phosphatidate cytidylyltransferase
VLFQRILTAAVLAPLLVGAVLLLSNTGLAVALGLVVLLGAVEWLRLSGITGLWRRLPGIGGIGLAMSALFPWLDERMVVYWLLGAAVLWWLVVMLILSRVRAEPERYSGPDLAQALSLLPVLVPAWAALVVLHGQGASGPLLVLFLVVLIWISDTAAYFGGRVWGRAKLAPHLSPGKTRAGVYSALAGAGLCAAFLAWWAPSGHPSAWLALPLCWVTTLISVVGDLFESLLKRQRGAKDSGQLLPGHGGVLDRIDSLTAAAPVFVLGWLLMGSGE